MADPARVLPLRRRNQTYEQLRDLIIRGRLTPGMRIVELDIAGRLNVSRTPVRQAIHRLHQDGFLITTAVARRTELVVAPLTANDLLDLYRLMGGLESTAVLGVMDLEPKARRELARGLRDDEAKFERVARAAKLDLDAAFDAHNAFHDRFVSAGAAPRLRALLETIRPQVERYEWVYAPLVGPDYAATFKEHRRIIAGIRDGDADGARDAVVDNWERGAERLLAVIERRGEKGSF